MAAWRCAFAQVLAAELLPRRIRVRDEITPAKRHGTSGEVAAATALLAVEATFT